MKAFLKWQQYRLQYFWYLMDKYGIEFRYAWMSATQSKDMYDEMIADGDEPDYVYDADEEVSCWGE